MNRWKNGRGECCTGVEMLRRGALKNLLVLAGKVAPTLEAAGVLQLPYALPADSTVSVMELMRDGAGTMVASVD